MVLGGRSAMGEGLQWFFSTIADLPGGSSAMGEGLQYNTGICPTLRRGDNSLTFVHSTTGP